MYSRSLPQPFSHGLSALPVVCRVRSPHLVRTLLQPVSVRSRAIGRRAAFIDSIAMRARLENERVAAVVAEVKMQKEEKLPDRIRRQAFARLQAAHVNRLNLQRAKSSFKTPTRCTLLGSPPSSSPPSAAVQLSKIIFLGPGGAGRVLTVAPKGAARSSCKETDDDDAAGHRHAGCPGLIIIAPHRPPGRYASVPPAPLLSRLLFRPRLLAATAAARHAEATGRRDTIRALRIARATLHGTVRVARACARRAASDELLAAMYAMREKRAGLLAAQHVRAVAGRARAANGRVIRAAMVRSARRIWLLDRAMQAESVRQEATNRREARLCTLREGRYERAAAAAAGVRVAKLLSARVLVATDRLNRCHLAASRRVAHLADVVCKAQLASGQLTRKQRSGGGGSNRHHSGKCTGNTLANNRSSNHVATLISAYVTDGSRALWGESSPDIRPSAACGGGILPGCRRVGRRRRQRHGSSCLRGR